MSSGALITDLYELNMAASYLACGMQEAATFSCFVRRLPPDRGFLVAAGLEDVLDYLESFGFDDPDLEVLAQLGFPSSTIEALSTLRFTGDVVAVPEGRLVGVDEPLVEITAPIAVAQLVETGVLNRLTYQTAIATTAVRCRLAAAGQIDLVEFGLRRAHGGEAGLAGARGAAIAGFQATSDVEAAARYGLVASGTMAHSYVEAFGSELDAFLAFGSQFPERSTFLVDTYDVASGLEQAMEAIERLGLSCRAAIRIDSGDLAALATGARRRLDERGLTSVRIFVSGNLDEHALAALVATGLPIDGAGVGTRLAVSADAPYVESAYKLVAYGDRPVAKQSSGKASLPGAKQVFRAAGLADVLSLRDEHPPPGSVALLEQKMSRGRRVDKRPAPAEAVETARRRCAADVAEMAPATARLRGPEPLIPQVSSALAALTDAVRAGRTRRLEDNGDPAES